MSCLMDHEIVVFKIPSVVLIFAGIEASFIVTHNRVASKYVECKVRMS